MKRGFCVLIPLAAVLLISGCTETADPSTSEKTYYSDSGGQCLQITTSNAVLQDSLDRSSIYSIGTCISNAGYSSRYPHCEYSNTYKYVKYTIEMYFSAQLQGNAPSICSNLDGTMTY